MELGLDLKLRSWSWNWSWNLRNWSWSWNLRSWSWSWYSGDLPELELELELKLPELELELELIFWRLAGVGVGVGVETSGVGVGVELILWSWPQPCPHPIWSGDQGHQVAEIWHGYWDIPDRSWNAESLWLWRSSADPWSNRGYHQFRENPCWMGGEWKAFSTPPTRARDVLAWCAV